MKRLLSLVLLFVTLPVFGASVVSSNIPLAAFTLSTDSVMGLINNRTNRLFPGTNFSDASRLTQGSLTHNIFPDALRTLNTNNGAGLTNLNASELRSGTVPDARLSANVPLLNAANIFTASNTFPNLGVMGTLGASTATAGTMTVGTVTGNGLGLTNIAASNIISGGVLALGTVSASAMNAGLVLGNDGALRQWTNRATIATIDGPTTVNGALTNTTYSSTGTNYATKLRVGGAAETADGINVTGSIKASTTVTGGDVVTTGTFYGPSISGLGYGFAFSSTVNRTLRILSTTALTKGITNMTWGAGTTNIALQCDDAATPTLTLLAASGTGGANLAVNGSLNVSNFLTLATNYVAANFVPTAGLVKICPSNGALYSVTQISTNLISGP